MLEPGAAISTAGPVLEKHARASVELVAATARTELNLAGYPTVSPEGGQAPEFPAAAT
jgi:hypothetical protein